MTQPHAHQKPAQLYALIFPNGKRYIGISTDAKKRFQRHKDQTEHGSQFSVHRAMRKYGHAAVQRQVLVIGPRDYILDLEARAIAAFDTQNPRHGYNLTAGGDANPMDLQSVRDKVRDKLKGRKLSPERIAAQRASFTSERRAAISAAHKGKKISDAQKALIAEKRILRCGPPKPKAPRLSKDQIRDKMRASSRVRWTREIGPRMPDAEAKKHWLNPAINQAKALALMPGWSRVAAYRALGKRGIQPLRFLAADLETAKVWKAEGVPAAIICAEFGISPTHLHRITKASAT